MNDQMFVEALITVPSFFAAAVVLVSLALLTKRTGQLRNATEIDQFWLRNTQVIRDFQDNGPAQHVYTRDDFIRSFEEQEVGNQFELRMEARRGDRAEDMACELISFRRAS